MKIDNTQLIEGRYLLGERVRQNSVVELYNALDRQLDRPVTLQVLLPGADAALFRRHRELAATIHHRSVLAVYDAGEWEGRPFSVMERSDGAPVSSLYPAVGRSPDVGAALRVTRQTAEALQYCRGTGLGDWAFSPDLVSVDPEGNARMALIEGLAGVAVSHGAAEDPGALGGLLRVMLEGDGGVGANLPFLPTGLMTLLERTVPGRPDRFNNAREVALAISTLESAFAEPTQSYSTPGAIAATTGVHGGTAPASPATERAVAPIYSPEAPTLASAPPVIDTAQTKDIAVKPYTPTTDEPGTIAVASPRVWPEKGRLLPLAGILGALLLGALLLIAPWLRGSGPAAATAPVSPTATPARIATVPDLQGKNLGEARDLLRARQLNLAAMGSVHDATFPVDTVARQVPGPGAAIEPGSYVTVTLSLGPEPQMARPPQVAPTPRKSVQEPVQQPPSKGKEGDKGEGKDKGKGKDK